MVPFSIKITSPSLWDSQCLELYIFKIIVLLLFEVYIRLYHLILLYFSIYKKLHHVICNLLRCTLFFQHYVVIFNHRVYDLHVFTTIKYDIFVHFPQMLICDMPGFLVVSYIYYWLLK